MAVAVVGAGAWGTALAKLIADKGESVTLWCREPEVLAGFRERRVNEPFLPDVPLPGKLDVTQALGACVRDKEFVLLAVPSQYLRSVLEELVPHVSASQRFVSATKGIEEGTLLRMSEVVADVLPFSPDLTAISGPTFAKEVARGEPTALVAASENEASALYIQACLATKIFRVYTNDDVIGVELGGALKNVIAIAVGVASGLGLGYNPAAALMTRGLAEISRLAEAMGGKRETLAGLSGVGDLVLTCTGRLSRNRTVGIALGEGQSLADIVSKMRQVAEGVATTHAAVALARAHQIEMPTTFQMERLLRGEATAREAMHELLDRPVGSE